MAQESTDINALKSSQHIGVLVVGDWLVDEHWVVGKHRATSSSRTGHAHSRALHRDTCSVRSLCGAGQVATILHQAKYGPQSPFQIHGVGIWHPGDGVILQEMLSPEFNIGRTPHHLQNGEADDHTDTATEGGRLWSLTPSELGVAAGTTRIIRIYRHDGDKIDLSQRIDWELPLSESQFAKIRNGVNTALRDIKGSIPPVQHIFVKDLQKGAVSPELIRFLKCTFPDAAWYVSSKAWRPNWLSDLPRELVKLLLIPQLAAQRAIDTGEISSSSWITTGGVPSRDAMNVINAFADQFKSGKIVVLPEGMRILARDSSNAYVLPTAGVADRLPFTPMASVFFPTLGAYMMMHNQEFPQALENAVSFTATWEESEAQRIRTDNWIPTPAQVLSIPDTNPGAESVAGAGATQWRRFDWQELESEWEQAFSGIGVVIVQDSKSGKESREFQLWRAMTDIDRYVTCLPSKRRHVLTLLREGRSLQHPDPDERRGKSVFLVDSPGSGKSFMVNCLAATLDLPCLKFNITAFSKREDLIECFRTLSAAQGQEPNKPKIVSLTR